MLHIMDLAIFPTANLREHMYSVYASVLDGVQDLVLRCFAEMLNFIEVKTC